MPPQKGPKKTPAKAAPKKPTARKRLSRQSAKVAAVLVNTPSTPKGSLESIIKNTKTPSLKRFAKLIIKRFKHLNEFDDVNLVDTLSYFAVTYPVITTTKPRKFLAKFYKIFDAIAAKNPRIRDPKKLSPKDFILWNTTKDKIAEIRLLANLITKLDFRVRRACPGYSSKIKDKTITIGDYFNLIREAVETS